MATAPPKIIAIDPDNHYAKHVGRTADRRQFFLTKPFEPALAGRGKGCEFVALYLFDESGQLLEAKIDSFGQRASMDSEAHQAMYEKRLQELGHVAFERICVAPFSIQRFGVTFGLVAQEPEEEGDPWKVEVQPGSYMAFYEPWDSGEYDT